MLLLPDAVVVSISMLLQALLVVAAAGSIMDLSASDSKSITTSSTETTTTTSSKSSSWVVTANLRSSRHLDPSMFDETTTQRNRQQQKHQQPSNLISMVHWSCFGSSISSHNKTSLLVETTGCCNAIREAMMMLLLRTDTNNNNNNLLQWLKRWKSLEDVEDEYYSFRTTQTTVHHDDEEEEANTDSAAFLRYCHLQRSVIPNVVHHQQQHQLRQQDSSSSKAIFSLLTHHHHHHDNNTRLDNNNRNDNVTSHIVDPIPSDRWTLVYHQDTGKYHVVDNNKHQKASPFHLPFFDDDNDDIKHDENQNNTIIKEDDDDDDNPQQQQRPIHYCQMESRLSERGGMHRTMQHRISFNDTTSWMTASSATTTTTTTTIHGKVHFVQWITQGMYLDAKDVFSNPIQTCTVVRTPDTAAMSEFATNISCNAKMLQGGDDESFHNNMDIEDTAFDSPQQHVIPFQVEFSIQWSNHSQQRNEVRNEVRNTGPTSRSVLVLEIVTKLHLRYPLPIINKFHTTTANQATTITRSPWRLVVIPTPSIYSVSFVQEHQREMSSTSSTTNVRHEWQILPFKNDPSYSLVTHAATGYQDDFHVVMLITMACIILGSILLFREILRVGQWT